MSIYNHIEIHGHRGARGLFPENTITSFIEAVKCGAQAIELDVVISKDNKVVVSHEPWMNALYCSKPNGIPINENTESEFNLYHMNYDEIKTYDCGIRGNKLFPSQIAVKEFKPLLSEVVLKVDEFTNLNGLKNIKYNIEIKSEEKDYGKFQPYPSEFVELVYNEIKQLGILNRCIVQSFDVTILRSLKAKYHDLQLSYLVENTNSLEHNLDLLGFYPDIYAPEYVLINEGLISDLDNKKIKLITWTVNEIEDMKRLINMGVNTIITDYPNKAYNLINK